MTTKHSPLRILKAQAQKIAETIKAAERGETVLATISEALAEARNKEIFKVAVFMDDKIITIDISWSKISNTSTSGLAEYILGLMREERRVVN